MMTDHMKRMDLKDFFIDSLEDIHDAEKKFMTCFAALGIAAVNEFLGSAQAPVRRPVLPHVGILSVH